MDSKMTILAALAAFFLCNPAAQAADVFEVKQPEIFTPYVPLGSHCEGKLTDQRLAGVPVPLPAGKSACSDLRKIGSGGNPNDMKPTLLIFDAGSGRIVDRRRY